MKRNLPWALEKTNEQKSDLEKTIKQQYNLP
jgi:hypothetical protein